MSESLHPANDPHPDQHGEKEDGRHAVEQASPLLRGVPGVPGLELEPVDEEDQDDAAHRERADRTDLGPTCHPRRGPDQPERDRHRERQHEVVPF